MPQVVYLLCAITSISCSYLLYRGFKNTKLKLLFWTSLGFFGFALNNILLFVDLLIVPQYDLSVIRTVPAFVGMLIFVYGLIMEEE